MTMDFRSELNGKEKVAQSLIGMESTGTPIVVNGQRADVILANEKKSKLILKQMNMQINLKNTIKHLRTMLKKSQRTSMVQRYYQWVLMH